MESLNLGGNMNTWINLLDVKCNDIFPDIESEEEFIAHFDKEQENYVLSIR